jgi:DNA replication protein DnaC
MPGLRDPNKCDQRDAFKLADALLDRLTSGAHRIELKGDTMRKKGATLTQTEAKK